MTKMQYIVSAKFFNWMNPQHMVKTPSHETKAKISNQVALWPFKN